MFSKVQKRFVFDDPSAWQPNKLQHRTKCNQTVEENDHPNSSLTKEGVLSAFKGR